MMLVARLKAVAVGVAFAASLVALTGAGVLFAARPQEPPSPKKAETAPSAPPAVARPGPWIRGIVVNEQGRPVSAARVSSLWTLNPKPVTTKADGTFVLPTDGPRPFERSLLATADGGARQGIYRFDGPSGLPRPADRGAGRAPAGPRGDGHRRRRPGTPGRRMRRSSPSTGTSRWRKSERTPAGSRCSACRPTRTCSGSSATRPGVGFDYFENDRGGRLTPWTRPPRCARLVLDGVRTVRVRAVDSADRPVPGVELSASMIRKKGKIGAIHIGGLTASMPAPTPNGVATFDWLPADLHGRTSFHPASNRRTTCRESALLDPDEARMPS